MLRRRPLSGRLISVVFLWEVHFSFSNVNSILFWKHFSLCVLLSMTTLSSFSRSSCKCPQICVLNLDLPVDSCSQQGKEWDFWEILHFWVYFHSTLSASVYVWMHVCMWAMQVSRAMLMPSIVIVQLCMDFELHYLYVKACFSLCL